MIKSLIADSGEGAAFAFIQASLRQLQNACKAPYLQLTSLPEKESKVQQK